MTAIHFIKYSTRKTLTPSKVCTCFGLGVVLWSCRHWVEASALKCLPNSFAGPHRSNEAASARICPGVRGGPARPSAQRPGRRFALAAQAARSASRRVQARAGRRPSSPGQVWALPGAEGDAGGFTWKNGRRG